MPQQAPPQQPMNSRPPLHWNTLQTPNNPYQNVPSSLVSVGVNSPIQPSIPQNSYQPIASQLWSTQRPQDWGSPLLAPQPLSSFPEAPTTLIQHSPLEPVYQHPLPEPFEQHGEGPTVSLFPPSKLIS